MSIEPDAGKDEESLERQAASMQNQAAQGGFVRVQDAKTAVERNCYRVSRADHETTFISTG